MRRQIVGHLLAVGFVSLGLSVSACVSGDTVPGGGSGGRSLHDVNPRRRAGFDRLAHRGTIGEFNGVDAGAVQHHDEAARLAHPAQLNRLAELLLMRVDKMSMGVSLEGRVPFLDKEVLKFIFSLSDEAIMDSFAASVATSSRAPNRVRNPKSTLSPPTSAITPETGTRRSGRGTPCSWASARRR